MDIIAEIKKLDLPKGKYVVVGSGAMIVRGLKEPHDIDIVVTPDVFEDFRNKGWEVIPWTLDDHKGQVFLRNGIFELYLDVNCGDFWPTIAELISRADIISGITFASLQDTIAFKKAYNRERYLKDVAVIEKFMAEQ